MIRDFVRAVAGSGAVLCLVGMSCPEELGPEGVLPAGDYRLVQSIAEAGWEVPTPEGTPAPCGTLVDARMLIDEDGGVLHTRSIRYLVNGSPATTVQELRPRLSSYGASSDTHLRYPGWFETIRAQFEPVPGDPEFTVLYAEQYFRANVGCPGRKLVLRYTVGGTNH